MKYQLIAFDLDGTLIRSDRVISERTKAAMQAHVKAGTILAIASGRALSSLPQELMRFPGVKYAITSNGAAVYDTVTGERIFHFPLESALAEKVLAVADEGWMNYEVFVEGIPYGQEEYVNNPQNYGIISEYSIEYIRRSRRPVEDLASFAWKHRAVLDCVSIRVADAEERSRLEARLRTIDDIFYTASMPTLVEVGNRLAGKGAALRRLAEFLSIPREAVLAFGNEENDMDMLEFAGIGVAVANSPSHVKAAADAVTGSNDDDGVAAYLEGLWK